MFSWRDGNVAFVESKWKGHDRIGAESGEVVGSCFVDRVSTRLVPNRGVEHGESALAQNTVSVEGIKTIQIKMVTVPLSLQ